MFHNIRHNTMLFVNAEDGEEAAAIFDSCGFARRSDWKIFLELGSQPTDGQRRHYINEKNTKRKGRNV